jgi:hypothetical protein
MLKRIVNRVNFEPSHKIANPTIGPKRPSSNPANSELGVRYKGPILATLFTVFGVAAYRGITYTMSWDEKREVIDDCARWEFLLHSFVFPQT